MALIHRNRRPIAFAYDPQHRQAQEDEGGADQGSFEVSGVAPNQNSRCAENKNGRQERISPHTIRALEIGALAAIVENGRGGEHVEQPLSEHRQLEMLLKLTEKEQ
jgi:hypothetical protein